MKLKSIAALILTASFIFTVTACTKSNNSDKKDKTETTTAAETTFFDDDADYEPLSLDESLYYNGAEVKILTSGSNKSSSDSDKGSSNSDNSYYKGELLVEDINNEPLNDTVFNREFYVEELLGVDIQKAVAPAGKAIRTHVEMLYNAGEVAADIISAPCAATMWSSQFGYYLDLTEIKNLDVSSPWWNQDFVHESSFGNKNYFLTGDIAVSLLRSMYTVLYNKKLANNYHIENVYDLVLDGKWTLDKFIELSSGIYEDLNGNSVCDSEDTYGLLTGAMMADPLWSAFDIDIISKDADDYMVFSPNLDKLGVAYEKVYNLYNAKSTFNNNRIESTEYVYEMFANDSGLFGVSFLAKAETETMRNMQSEYGILPLPKFDEAQENYYTLSHDQYTVFGMMATLPRERAEIAAAVLEALGWYSYRYLTPTYMNVVMKGKYANDSNTRKMLDIIKDGLKIDTAWIYAYYLEAYPQAWRYNLLEDEPNYASVFAKKERNMKIKVKGLNDAYRSIAEN